jgi:hypothetical protein
MLSLTVAGFALDQNIREESSSRDVAVRRSGRFRKCSTRTDSQMLRGDASS